MEKFYTAGGAAKAMGVSKATILNWIKMGIIPGVCETEIFGKRTWQIPESALQMQRPRQGVKTDIDLFRAHQQQAITA